MPLWDGNLALRALISNISDSYRIPPGSAPVISLGGPGTPEWRGTLSATYAKDNWSVFVSERFIGKSLIDPTREEGTYTNDNSLPRVGYTNITAKYKFSILDRDQEVFFSVSNLFNADPPVSGGNPTSYNTPSAFAYDTMGRYFNFGLRFVIQ